MRGLLLVLVTFGFINSATGSEANWLQRQAQRLHDEQVEGEKKCYTDHYHYREAEGKTQKVATDSAIDYWQGFTAWEYGMKWGSWSLASDRKVECEQNAKNRIWLCKVSGRPCRLR